MIREKIKIGDIISIKNVPRNIMSINFLGDFITQDGKVIDINDNKIEINGNIKLSLCSTVKKLDSLIFETYDSTYAYQTIKLYYGNNVIISVDITKNN